jgi:hypothetical protein
VLDCGGGEPLKEVPQPASAIRQAKSDSILRDLFPGNPRKNNGIGETSAKMRPEGEPIHWLLLVALMVIFVLAGVLPDNVEGAKLQPHPLGRPEQAKDNEALNPFSGATETINDPGALCVMVRVPLESVSP